jgi:anti-repressor protein
MPTPTLPATLDFDFDGAPIRTISRNGDPWFVLVDVCRVLDINNSSYVAERLDPDEKSGVVITDPHGRPQNTTIVSESGLYAVVLTSRKPEARKFRRWVTGEVAPSIRRTGGYGNSAVSDAMAMLSDPASMRKLLASYAEQAEHDQARLAITEPKARALDTIAGTSGTFCITDAAKKMQKPPRKTFDFMANNRWIFKREGSPYWHAYQDKLDAGHLVEKVTTQVKNSREFSVTQVRVTARGLAKLAVQMAPPPLMLI